MTARHRPRARLLSDEGVLALLLIGSTLSFFAIAIAVALHPEWF